jgi:hypothetical protein
MTVYKLQYFYAEIKISQSFSLFSFAIQNKNIVWKAFRLEMFVSQTIHLVIKNL